MWESWDVSATVSASLMGIAAIPRARSLRRAVAALLVAHVSPHPLVVLLERSAATAPVKPVFARLSLRVV